MAEYIERKKAIEAFDDLGIERYYGDVCLESVISVIEQIPAADVRPVVHGHWISTKEAEDMGDIMKEFTCSVCGCCEWDCTESESFNFCPNCGADMRKLLKKE